MDICVEKINHVIREMKPDKITKTSSKIGADSDKDFTIFFHNLEDKIIQYDKSLEIEPDMHTIKKEGGKKRSTKIRKF